MKVVLDATGYSKLLEPLVHQTPTPLLKIVDKPIIFHIIEFIIRQDIKNLEIVLSHLPHQIESVLGDGERFGITINYRFAQEPAFFLDSLRGFFKMSGEEVILLASADYLPQFGFEDREVFPHVIKESWMWCEQSGEWTGWGVFRGDTLLELPRGVESKNATYKINGKTKKIFCDPLLTTRSLKEYMRSNERFIAFPPPRLLFPTTIREVEPGIWMANSTFIAPKTKINPPVFIGENVRIEEGVEIGPLSIIEKNCVIDKGSKVVESLVCENSYVGEKLQLQNSIVKSQLLINLPLDVIVTLSDPMLLDDMSKIPFSLRARIILSQVLAIGLWVLFSPMYYLLKWQGIYLEKSMLNVPTSSDHSQWTTFQWKIFQPAPGEKWGAFKRMFQFLPLLCNVMRGEMRIVGLKARTVEEVEALGYDWKRLYIKSKVGLITLADVEMNTKVSPDQLYAYEAYYATHASMGLDLKIVCKFLWQLIF